MRETSGLWHSLASSWPIFHSLVLGSRWFPEKCHIWSSLEDHMNSCRTASSRNQEVYGQQRLLHLLCKEMYWPRGNRLHRVDVFAALSLLVHSTSIDWMPTICLLLLALCSGLTLVNKTYIATALQLLTFSWGIHKEGKIMHCSVNFREL